MQQIETTLPKRNRMDYNPLIAILEEILDRFYLSDYMPVDIELSNIATVKPTQIRHAIQYYQELLLELTSNDPQVKEAYARLSKKQKKNYVEFVNSIVGMLNQTKINARRSKPRKARKRKEKTAAQLTKGVKYLLEDKELNATSLPPDKIVGASTVWIFNTKTRKLAKYQAGENKTLSVKGTTIIGYDEAASSQKTIRKPKDMVASTMTMARVPLANAYDQIRAVASPVNGRINGYTLILRII